MKRGLALVLAAPLLMAQAKPALVPDVSARAIEIMYSFTVCNPRDNAFSVGYFLLQPTSPANVTVACLNNVPPADVTDVTASDNCDSVDVSFVTDVINLLTGKISQPVEPKPTK